MVCIMTCVLWYFFIHLYVIKREHMSNGKKIKFLWELLLVLQTFGPAKHNLGNPD